MMRDFFFAVVIVLGLVLVFAQVDDVRLTEQQLEYAE